MCKGKKAAVSTGGPKAEIDQKVPVFMDDANDGDPDDLKEIYEDPKQDKKTLLTFQNSAGSTALHLAANNGHAEIVEYLVEKIC